MTKSTPLPLALLLVGACAAETADNAYLTLAVLWEPAAEDAAYARLGFRRTSDSEFIYDAAQKLEPDVTSQRIVAIEARGQALDDGALEVRLERCQDVACAQPFAVESLILTRAFYRGEQTRVLLTQGAYTGSDTLELDACAVEGCGGYCDAQQRHLCD